MAFGKSARQERAGRNQSLFRAVNEHLKPLNVAGAELSADETFVIACECADRGCSEMLTVRAREYEAIRANPTHFAVLRGHVDREVEDVFGLFRGGLIVNKLGAGADVAEAVADDN